MITLQHNSFWARVYFVADEIWAGFLDSHRRLHRQQTDTCRFLRTIFVVAPLVVIFHLAAFALVIFTVLVNPILLFGVGYGWFWASIGGIALMVVIYKAVKKIASLPKFNAPRFAKDAAVIVRAHYRGWKERFCPIIRFEGN